MKKTSTNSIDDPITGLATIDTSAWIQFSDTFNPTRLVTVKEAAYRNVRYSFLYDVFIDGRVALERRKYHPSLHDAIRYSVSNCSKSRPLATHDISVCLYAAFAENLHIERSSSMSS
jgi:hypothetical protein